MRWAGESSHQNFFSPLVAVLVADAFKIFFIRGRKVFEPPRYMTVRQASDQLLEILQIREFNEQPCK